MNNYKVTWIVNGHAQVESVTAENPAHACTKISEIHGIPSDTITRITITEDIVCDYCKTTNNAHHSAACVDRNHLLNRQDNAVREVCNAFSMVDISGLGLVSKKKLTFREFYLNSYSEHFNPSPNMEALVRWIEETFLN